jgi:hypothetical protein
LQPCSATRPQPYRSKNSSAHEIKDRDPELLGVADQPTQLWEAAIIAAGIAAIGYGQAQQIVEVAILNAAVKRTSDDLITHKTPQP